MELMFRDSPKWKVRDDALPAGWMVVSGPAVVGGEVQLGTVAGMRDEGVVGVLYG